MFVLSTCKVSIVATTLHVVGLHPQVWGGSEIKERRFRGAPTHTTPPAVDILHLFTPHTLYLIMTPNTICERAARESIATTRLDASNLNNLRLLP